LLLLQLLTNNCRDASLRSARQNRVLSQLLLPARRVQAAASPTVVARTAGRVANSPVCIFRLTNSGTGDSLQRWSSCGHIVVGERCGRPKREGKRMGPDEPSSGSTKKHKK
jgi:hypothetical protein